MTTSETIDLTPTTLVTPQLFSILNDNTVATTSNRVQDIRGASVLTTTDGLLFSLQLTEYERIRALEISNTPGGDGSAVLLETLAGAYYDIGQNPSLHSAEHNVPIVVTEYRDSIRPSLTQAWLDLNNGTLRVFFDETIDSTPTSLVTPSSFNLINIGGDVSTHTAALVLSSSTVVPQDGYSVTLVLSELERVRAIERGATTGGDGSPLTLTLLASAVHDIGTNPSFQSTELGVEIAETSDTTPPRILSATLDLGTKVMIITANEWIDSTPGSLIDLSEAYITNDAGTWTGTSFTAKDFTNDNQNLIVVVDGTSQTINVVANCDTALNCATALTAQITGATVSVVGADLVPPVPNMAITSDATGSSSTISITLAGSGANTLALFMDLPLGTYSVHSDVTLVGAEVVGYDGYNVTIHLTETMRVGALKVSGMPLLENGDGGIASELVLPPGAFMDIGQNRQTEQAIIQLLEYSDRVKPTLIRAVIDYNDGRLDLYPSETLHPGKYLNVVVTIVKLIFINSTFFYCLLCNRSFPTNPNSSTNPL